jgi:aromatic ring hydroxylase
MQTYTGNARVIVVRISGGGIETHTFESRKDMISEHVRLFIRDAVADRPTDSAARLRVHQLIEDVILSEWHDWNDVPPREEE